MIFLASLPAFTSPIRNISVPVGRDAHFTCNVRKLGSFKVSYFTTILELLPRTCLCQQSKAITPPLQACRSKHAEWHQRKSQMPKKQGAEEKKDLLSLLHSPFPLGSSHPETIPTFLITSFLPSFPSEWRLPCPRKRESDDILKVLVLCCLPVSPLFPPPHCRHHGIDSCDPRCREIETGGFLQDYPFGT